jgi:hypothetical protein
MVAKQAKDAVNDAGKRLSAQQTHNGGGGTRDAQGTKALPSSTSQQRATTGGGARSHTKGKQEGQGQGPQWPVGRKHKAVEREMVERRRCVDDSCCRQKRAGGVDEHTGTELTTRKKKVQLRTMAAAKRQRRLRNAGGGDEETRCSRPRRRKQDADDGGSGGGKCWGAAKAREAGWRKCSPERGSRPKKATAKKWRS